MAQPEPERNGRLTVSYRRRHRLLHVHRRAAERQAEEEVRAAARLGLHPHIAAAIENRLSRECEAQAQTILLARADERLKQVLADLRRNAGAAVRHLDDSAVWRGMSGDLYPAARRHGFQSIADQIDEDAL